MTTHTEIKASKFFRHVTVNVKGLALAKLRMRAATVIFIVAAWVAGCSLEMDIQYKGKPF